HIDALIRRLIEQHNVPLHVAYRVASWSTARHFGLNHLGLLAPGKQADIVLLSDARKVTVQSMHCGLLNSLINGASALRLRAADPSRII
ncbi:amidohydrolase family protein, partial [Mycobacterium tuberculosis]|uniref:amidohydrolase family protein n=1 Tax=Mycobacterium tuberculosis TaxID=1773 RepID=UPI00254A12EB